MNISRKMLKACSYQWCTYLWQQAELLSISIGAQSTSGPAATPPQYSDAFPPPSSKRENSNPAMLCHFQATPGASSRGWGDPSISRASRKVAAFPAPISCSLSTTSPAAGGCSTQPGSQTKIPPWFLLSQVLDQTTKRIPVLAAENLS